MTCWRGRWRGGLLQVSVLRPEGAEDDGRWVAAGGGSWLGRDWGGMEGAGLEGRGGVGWDWMVAWVFLYHCLWRSFSPGARSRPLSETSLSLYLSEKQNNFYGVHRKKLLDSPLLNSKLIFQANICWKCSVYSAIHRARSMHDDHQIDFIPR